MEEKIIAVLKKLDTEYNQIYDKALWCKEHNFKLEEISLFSQAEILGKVRIMLRVECDIE